MEFLQILLKKLFEGERAGGETVGVNISFVSETHCSRIACTSSSGGDQTVIDFVPPMLLEEAILKARRYKDKGVFQFP